MDDGGSEPPHPVHVGETVLAEIEVPRGDVTVLVPVEVVFRPIVPHIASEEDPLCLAAVHQADPGRRVARGGVFKAPSVGLDGRDAVAAVEVHVLASLGHDGLELDGEEAFPVLCVEEGRDGGEPVGDLHRTVVPTRFDGKHINPGPCEQAAGAVADSEIELGSTAVLDVVGRRSGRAGGSVLHLPEGRTGEGDGRSHLPVQLDLGCTGEGAERGSGVEGEHIGHVGCHGMPCLAGRDHPVVLPDRGVGLTEAELGSACHPGKAAVEVGLDLTPDVEAFEHETDKVHAEPGGQCREPHGSLLVEVDVPGHVHVLREVEEEILRPGDAFPGVECIVVAYEAIRLELADLVLG